MSREWRPGDVASFEVFGGGRVTAIRTSEGKWTAYAPGRERSWLDRPWDGRHGQRPLVIIDPEDREQVKAVIAAIERVTGRTAGSRHVDNMQAALRSLLTPPKPEEPTGLGAVVEDAKGERFVRHAADGKRFWCDARGVGHRYTDIAAVKVLSPGVTS